MTTYKELADYLDGLAHDLKILTCPESEDQAKVREAVAILRGLDAQPLFWYRPTCGGEMYEGPVHNNSVGGKMLRDEKPDEWKPLYAAPLAAQAQQASKPLSDDEMWDLWNAQGNDEMHQQDAVAFAEAAITAFCLKNGIKEST